MSIFNDNLKTIYPDIMRVSKKMTKYNTHDAEDLVQKTLLKALEKQKLFKGGNLTGWVVTIMQNTFRDEFRKVKGKEFIDFDDETLNSRDKSKLTNKEDDGFRTLNDQEASLEFLDVNDALNKIGSKCKEILLLIAEEYKYKEISKRLDVPMGTVMNRLLRCRKKLHQELYELSEYNEI